MALDQKNGNDFLLIFSKMMTGVWPNCQAVAARADRAMAAYATKDDDTPGSVIVEAFQCTKRERVNKEPGTGRAAMSMRKSAPKKTLNASQS